MKIEMTEKEKKALIKAQQAEMDAVLVYKNLARIAKTKAHKEQFTLMAAEEGKHASILKIYTETTLKPKAFKSMAVLLINRVLGYKKMTDMLAKNELKAASSYEELVEKYKKIKEIMSDERKHAEILKKIGAQQ